MDEVSISVYSFNLFDKKIFMILYKDESIYYRDFFEKINKFENFDEVYNILLSKVNNHINRHFDKNQIKNLYILEKRNFFINKLLEN